MEFEFLNKEVLGIVDEYDTNATRARREELKRRQAVAIALRCLETCTEKTADCGNSEAVVG